MEASEKVESSEDEQYTEESWKPHSAFGGWLNKYFSISKRHSSLFKEIIGGLVTFLAMFYILPVNANMLANNWTSVTGATTITLYGTLTATVGEVYAAVFAATAISAGVTTILMGFYGKLPVGLASGMGINALIAFTVMLGLGYNFAQAMCLVLVDGILFLIISITPLRSIIVRSIPKSLKVAISAGIGFFIAFIGFQNAGIIVADQSTAVALGDFTNPAVICAAIGLVLVLILSSLPQTNKACYWISKFAVIIAMVVMGIICASCGSAGVKGMPSFYTTDYSISSLSNFGKIFGACFHGFDVFLNGQAYAVAFTLLFIDFFDTTGTLVGVETGAGMVDKEGIIKVNDKPAMITDAVGTCLGAICGTTTVTSFVESTTGVAAGARTGLASVVTGLMFLLSLAIYPFLGMFSSNSVTALALIFVGVCMFKNLKNLDWSDWVAVGSAFITILMMVITYSISDGIAWGFISYTIMKVASRKFEKGDIPVACIGAAFVVLYIVEYATGIK